MTEVYWLLGTLLLALGYDAWAGVEIKNGVRRMLGLKEGLIISAAFISVSLLLYVLKLPGYVLVCGGALATHWAVWLGMRYWSEDADWQSIGSRIVAGFLMVAMWLKYSPFLLNNVLIVFIGSGLGCYFGRRLTKGFAYLFYTLLIFLDAYAVWYSNIMSTLIEKYSAAVPTGLVSLTSGMYMLGLGDIVFASIGCMTIKAHAGTRWALAVTAGYAVTFALMDWPAFTRLIPSNLVSFFAFFPAMVTICPVTMLCLWLGTRKTPGPDNFSLK